MKKLLPQSKLNPQGFTLIELLVVISIIAVLAIMGFAAFRGFTGRGNDARRNADLKAIGDALEANRNAGAGSYVVLADSMFANGKIPVDPSGVRNYCVSSVTTAGGTIGNKPGPWATAGCPAAAAGVGISGTAFSVVSTTAPAAATTTWMVCTTMEDGATVNCRNSSQ